jgi:ABC-type taurine transport system ATPase subunit
LLRRILRLRRHLAVFHARHSGRVLVLHAGHVAMFHSRHLIVLSGLPERVGSRESDTQKES